MGTNIKVRVAKSLMRLMAQEGDVSLGPAEVAYLTGFASGDTETRRRIMIEVAEARYEQEKSEPAD